MKIKLKKNVPFHKLDGLVKGAVFDVIRVDEDQYFFIDIKGRVNYAYEDEVSIEEAEE